jgi:putative glutamine amidotransferase
VDRLGRGLRAVAWAPDGVIEGIEDARRGFLVGVQWHAETLVHRPEHDALFAGLIEAAAAGRGRQRVRSVA